MKAASSLRRKAAKNAISSGLDTLPAGLGTGPWSSPSSDAPSRSRYSGVSTFPVTIAFDPHAVAWAFQRRRACQADNPVLGGNVCGHAGYPADSADRGVVEDRPSASGAEHCRDLLLQAVEDAGELLQFRVPCHVIDGMNWPGGLLANLPAPSADNDGGAFRNDPAGHCPSNPARPSGDDHDLGRETADHGADLPATASRPR